MEEDEEERIESMPTLSRRDELRFMVVGAGGWIGVYHDITNLLWGNCLVEMNRVYIVILLVQQVCLNLAPVGLGVLLLLSSNF